jgi:O-antigen/teichoic acid export membrane protein
MRTAIPEKAAISAPERRGNLGFARSAAWNYAGYAGEVAAGLFLAAFVVRRVPVVEYGLFLFMFALAGALYLLDLGISNLLVQTYVSAARDDSRQTLSDALSTAFVTLTGLGVIGVAILCAVSLVLPGPFHIPAVHLREARIILVLAALTVQAGMSATALDHVYQAFHRFDRLNQLQLIATVARVGLTVWALSAGYGVVMLAVIQLLITLLRLLALWLGLPSANPNARLNIRRFSWVLLKDQFRNCKWSSLDDVSAHLASVSDQAILAAFSSMGAVAIFGVGGKLPRQIEALVVRGTGVILPALSLHHLNADEVRLRTLFVNAHRLIFTAVLPVVVLGCICARPLLELWAGIAYVGAAPVMQWLLIAVFSAVIHYPSGLLLYARGQFKAAARIAAYSSLANIAVSVLLVSRLGAVGLAIGTAVTHAFFNLSWYTPSACRAAGMSLGALTKAVIKGTGIQVCLLGAEVGLLCVLFPLLTPAWFVLTGITCGIAYLALWAVQTAMPMWRDERIRPSALAVAHSQSPEAF